FTGVVPEIDPDETSLPSHVIQQLGAALQGARETRRARDLNFRARGVMLLGAAYPVLAVRDGEDWQRGVRPTVGDWSHTEVADYEVSIETPADVAVFASGVSRQGRAAETGNGQAAEDAKLRRRVFAGENLRKFALIAGRNLRAEETAVSGTLVRSVWATEHEKTGRRVLEQAAAAVRVYAKRFGPLPYSSITVAEAPLVAGVGSAEFSGLSVIAGALYVDFDSPLVRNLPEIVREQRASVEDSLEFTVAHMVAHQWWGVMVGSAPERQPVLDEALAHWSALLYYEETHGPERTRAAREDQLRGVYEIYRTFGGEDLAADRPAREYRNSFQYAAVVFAKGALMFNELRGLLGEEKFFTALRRYAEANRFEIARLDDLRGAFVAEAPLNQRRVVTRIFDRWLSERHGDEDIAPPNPQLASALGLPIADSAGPKDRNAFSRLGRFFWRQMTRIR
ncbi:MAG: M1 family aminopeptidase, partial [Pyrinomonadaceae bacterium]